MRKLLFFYILTIALSASAYAQYQYYPYGGSTATPYSVPDAIVQSGINTLNMTGLHGNEVLNGLWARDFDQFDAAGPSVLANDENETFGINSSVGDTGGGDIRGWTTPAGAAYTPVRMNGNPQVFNQPGYWAYYTINFTQAGRYKLLYRQRNINGTNPRRINGCIYDFSIHSFDNFPAAIKTMNTVDFNVNTNNWTVPGNVDNNGTTTIDMLGGYVTYIADPQTTKSGQVGSVWLMVNDEIEITDPGKYVLKVNNNHTGGNGGGSIGAISFLQTEEAPEASFALTTGVNVYTVIEGEAIPIILTLTNNGSDDITEDISIDFADPNFSFASANGNFSGTVWTIPGLANGASVNLAVEITPEVPGNLVLNPQIDGFFTGTQSMVAIEVYSIADVVPVSLWVVIAAFAGLFGVNILRRKRRRK